MIYASSFEGSCLEILKDDPLHSLEITFFIWQQELSLKFQSSFPKLPFPNVYGTVEKVMNIFEKQVADEKTGSCLLIAIKESIRFFFWMQIAILDVLTK